MSVSLIPAHGRWSYPAAGNIAAGQYSFVQVNTSGEIQTPAGAGDLCMVLDDAPALGGSYTAGTYYGCVFEGVIKVQLGGTVNAGQLVTTDANGKAVVASSGNSINGVAMASGVSGDLVPIRVTYSGALHP